MMGVIDAAEAHLSSYTRLLSAVLAWIAALGGAIGCPGARPTTVAPNGVTDASVSVTASATAPPASASTPLPPAPAARPTPTTLARNIDWFGAPQGPVVAGNEILYARGCRGTAGEILAVPANGGAPRSLAQDQSGCGGLATGDGRVFWTSQADESYVKRQNPDGSVYYKQKGRSRDVVRVMSAPVAGGDVTVLLRLKGCCEGPIAADRAGIVLDDPDASRGLTTVGYDGKGALAVTPANIVGFGRGIAIDEASVYYQEQDVGTSVVKKAPRAGGVSVVIASEATPGEIIDIRALAVDQSSVYYALKARGAKSRGLLRVVPKSGGASETIAEGAIADVACDASGVYWVELGSEERPDGRVMMKKPGTPADVLAFDLAAPCGIALDASSIYWLECGTLLERGTSSRTPGTVARIAKPR